MKQGNTDLQLMINTAGQRFISQMNLIDRQALLWSFAQAQVTGYLGVSVPVSSGWLEWTPVGQKMKWQWKRSIGQEYLWVRPALHESTNVHEANIHRAQHETSEIDLSSQDQRTRFTQAYFEKSEEDFFPYEPLADITQSPQQAQIRRALITQKTEVLLVSGAPLSGVSIGIVNNMLLNKGMEVGGYEVNNVIY